MCNECLSTARSAARDAYDRLQVGVAFLNSEDGKRYRSKYYVGVTAGMNAQTDVLIRSRPDEGARATPADLHSLSKAEEAFGLMAYTDAGQVKPYLDFSSAREDVTRAIAKIERLWAEDPDGHPQGRSVR
jgi:hypothetical protein